MTTVSLPVASRRRTGALALLTLAIALPVSACGSSGNTGASAAATTSTAAAQAACVQVSDVLSDGPDPGSDPVGYAEAQILPLQQIHTTDATLSKAISALASGYSGFYTASGKSDAAKSALTTAVNRINSLCPGLGATA